MYRQLNGQNCVGPEYNGTGKNIPCIGSITQTDPTIVQAAWVPVDQNHENDSLVHVTVRSVRYSGPITLRVYQQIPPSVRNVVKNIPIGPAVSTMVSPGDLQLNLRVDSPPDRGLFYLNMLQVYFLVRIEGGRSANLPVADPSAISAELEGAVPMANTPFDRVTLWLRRHRDLIIKDAAERKIPAEAIAGAVAWEGLQNVAPLPLKFEGPGKVHYDDGSAADQVEQLHYLPAAANWGDRLMRLLQADWALRYIAAIMGAYADLSDKAGSGAIRGRPEILTTLYQGVSIDKNLIPSGPFFTSIGVKDSQTAIRPLNASAYFSYKARTGQPYQPNAEMGSWVQKNLGYLTNSLR